MLSPARLPPLQGHARKEALEHIHTALHCDLALSEGQLLRHYRVVPSEKERALLGLRTVRAVLNLTYHANQSVEVYFYTPYLWITRIAPHLLRHLAGVGQMRYMLKISPHQWRTDTDRIHFRETPDACWYSNTGPVAIEYDAGSYTLALLQRKVRTFTRRFTGQYWGVPSEKKAASLRQKLAGFGLDPKYVLVAPWW